MDAQSSFAQDVLAVIVIYEMKISASPTFQSLEGAVQWGNQQIELLIYDNSCNQQELPSSNTCLMSYEHNVNNGGVSIAYNEALEIAKTKNKKWLWLFDQDDTFEPDTFLKYENAVKSNPMEEVFIPQVFDQKSLLSPFQFRFGSGKRIKEVGPGIYSLEKFFFINSGLLITVNAFEKAGGYSNDFPLDFSDIDFVTRLRKTSERLVVLPLITKHNLSGSAPESLAKKLDRFRSYLQAANRFRIVHRKYAQFILFRTLARAIKLSAQYHTLKFLKVFRYINF